MIQDTSQRTKDKRKLNMDDRSLIGEVELKTQDSKLMAKDS